jgi:serine/threonine protein kinase
MSELDDGTLDDRDDELLRALASTPEVAPFSGTERYAVRSCLGEGGFGVVYEVEDTKRGRRLALKMLKPQTAGYAANIARLKREFRSVADLVHPNLVGLHELASEGRRWFFTMDRVGGVDFLEWVRGGAGPGTESGVLSESRLRASLRQLVRGVSALHEHGIVHRDLKPSNVLVEPSGRVVILDFGLAGADLPGELDFAGVPGTPAYMAPEQAAGGAGTAASDWYAVGVMLYQALTGRLPDGAPSRWAQVPADLEALCLALLARDPAARPGERAIAEALGERLDARPTTPFAFVGREPELTALREAFEAVCRQEPAVVRVRGPAGIGKSALLAHFLGELEGVCLAGRCHERESVPFKALDGVLDALVSYLRALPRNEASALLPRDVHLVTQLFPALDAVAAVRDVPRRAEPGSRHEARARAFAAIKELLGRVADKQPLVVVIDDLQWGDVDSARLLSHLFSPPERPPMLLILAHRDSQEEWSAGLHETLRIIEAASVAVRDLAVAPLANAEAERLALELVGDPSLARQIAARADGHPLFMAELARIVELDPTPQAEPPTLLDILWRRVLQLPSGARSLLETIAIAGQPLPSRLCLEAAGLGDGDLDAMRTLRAEKLAVTGGETINVFHDRVRDAILIRAEPGQRRARHLALARTLERHPAPDLESLARHFDAGGEGAAAARYAARAGEVAMGALAFDRAAELFRMAIAHDTESAALHERLGEALEGAGADVAAGQAYLAAARLSPGDAALDRLRRGAEHLLQVGELEAGREALLEAMAAVGERCPGSPRRALVHLLYNLARLRLRGFQVRERDPGQIDGRELLRLDVLDSASRGLGYNATLEPFALGVRFSRAALAAGEPRRAAMGRVSATIAIMGTSHERSPLIDELLDGAEAVAERFDDPDLRAWALRWRGTSYEFFGEPARARKSYAEAADWVAQRCVRLATVRRFCLVAGASMDLRTGELERARRVIGQALLDAVERSDPVATRRACVMGLAPLALADGDADEAARALERAPGETRCGSMVFGVEAAAAIALYRGDPVAAVEAWRRWWPLIKEEGMMFPPGFRIVGVRSLAIALLARGERGDLREARRHLRKIRRYRFPWAAAVRAAIGANLALRRRREAEAIALLDEAAGQYDATGMPLDAAAARLRKGQLLGGEEGAALIEAAAAALRARGVRDPERWSAVLYPPIG